VVPVTLYIQFGSGMIIYRRYVTGWKLRITRLSDQSPTGPVRHECLARYRHELRAEHCGRRRPRRAQTRGIEFLLPYQIRSKKYQRRSLSPEPFRFPESLVELRLDGILHDAQRQRPPPILR